MKLYVWQDAYQVSWGQATLFVMADSLEEARIKAADAATSSYGNDPREGNQIAHLGEPDWIRDLPFAFVYEWQE